MALTHATKLALELEETDGRGEIFHGELREKPPMSVGHNEAVWELMQQLMQALPRDQFRVRQNSGHLRLPDGDSYVPDLFVLPVAMLNPLRSRPRTLEAYSDPLPLVVEVWSPSTGTYDIDQKIPGYIRRGDLEIWRLHPFERTLQMWRRQLDGRYVESIVRTGSVTLHAIPTTTIEVARLFVPE